MEARIDGEISELLYRDDVSPDTLLRVAGRGEISCFSSLNQAGGLSSIKLNNLPRDEASVAGR